METERIDKIYKLYLKESQAKRDSDRCTVDVQVMCDDDIEVNVESDE